MELVQEENCSVDEVAADVILTVLLKLQLTVSLTVLLTMLLKLLLTPPCPGQSEEQTATADGSLEADSSFLEANSFFFPAANSAMITQPPGPDDLQVGGVGDIWRRQV